MRDWNEYYATGNLPWDTGEPDPSLITFVEQARLPPGSRILEIGCGTGTNALWLARQGFEVFACDLAPLAIERAEQKAAGQHGVRFQRLDFLSDPLPDETFGFAFDRGVFHTFDEHEQRSRFAERIASRLLAGSLWASLVGSTEGPPRDHGPPRRSLRDVVLAVEPHLEVVEVRRVDFTANIPSPAAGYWVLSRAREVPAQPSSRIG